MKAFQQNIHRYAIYGLKLFFKISNLCSYIFHLNNILWKYLIKLLDHSFKIVWMEV